MGLFALQFAEGFGEAVIFFLIGGVFVAGYLYRRAYGLLIPGCILLGLGLGSVGERGVALIVTGLASASKDFERLLSAGWPLILVSVGLLVLAGAFGLTGRKEQDDVTDTQEPR